MGIPAVSIVIPVYNGEQTISRALESVFAQVYSNFEVIVVDDASTDQTASLVGSYHDQRLKLIRSSENRGAGAARNKGIAAAQGKWVAFLDADDAWKPTKLERQLAWIGRTEGSVAACATGYDLEKGGRKQSIIPNLTSDQFRKDILFGCSISPGSTLLVDRIVFDEIGGFDETFRRLEDWDWLLRFSESHDMNFMRESLSEIYITSKEPPLGLFGSDPVQDGIRRMDEKHSARLRSSRDRRAFKSSLLIERAAFLHRNERQVSALLYVIAGLAVFPIRNRAFFRTLWRATSERFTLPR